MVYRFAVILRGLDVIDDELANALYEAGCDDGSPFSSCGVATVGFDREADCLNRLSDLRSPMFKRPAASSNTLELSTIHRCCRQADNSSAASR